tara:strand:+ start:2264 stop:2725 length:462 start_codon:yes stop_codon:yes gene_type:complete
MYVKITSGSVDQYPYTFEQLRRDNSNVSFPKQISDRILQKYGVHEVTVDALPSYNEKTQNVAQNDAPTLVDSSWVLGWGVSEKTSEEITQYNEIISNQNRVIRNQKLAETDFYALSDVTMSSEMTVYRQALRDLPATASNWPHLQDSDWPTKP